MITTKLLYDIELGNSRDHPGRFPPSKLYLRVSLNERPASSFSTQPKTSKRHVGTLFKSPASPRNESSARQNRNPSAPLLLRPLPQNL